jgi:hypothetical protein
VEAAEIVRDRDRQIDPAVSADLDSAEFLFLRLESIAADAAAYRRLPREL